MFNIAEITINYKPSIIFSETEKVSSSLEAYNILRQGWDNISYKESFKLLLLNQANKVLGISLIAIGGVSALHLDFKTIFQTGLKANASFLILAHNHPSGNIKPSEADIKMTRRCVDLGKQLDLVVIDHIILTATDYYSFGDNCKI